MELAHQRQIFAADSSCRTELALAPKRGRMTLQTLVALMIARVQKDAGLIANKLARGRNRQVCIDALRTALAGAVNGTTLTSHGVVVDGKNVKIKLAVHEGGQVVALVEFKIWMAVDILELVQQGKLTSDHPIHGIYGAYKKDYDKLVVARNQQWENCPVPLTASCTLVYFINPAPGALQVKPYPNQVAEGAVWAANLYVPTQIKEVSEKFWDMVNTKRQNNLLPLVQPTLTVTHLMTTTAKHYPPDENDGAVLPANEQHTITLAAVWTEIR